MNVNSQTSREIQEHVFIRTTDQFYSKFFASLSQAIAIAVGSEIYTQVEQRYYA